MRFARVLWTRLRLWPNSAAICRTVSPWMRRRAILAASTAIDGLPNFFPFTRAFRNPARTLSTIKLRSNSAAAPKTVKTIFPAGVDVSICSENETKSQCFECFQRPKQVRNRARKSVESPDANHIEAALVGVGHETVQFGPRIL